MIQLAHVATGGAAGAHMTSRRGAVLAGLALHLAADLVPHEDIHDRRFEAATAIGGILALARGRGLLHPTVLGAIAAAAPDLEHVLPLPRPGGRKLFHRGRHPAWRRWVPVWAQLLGAGTLLGASIRFRR